MNNGQIRDLCVSLLHAETEEEVEQLLDEVGYWDNPAVWRHYGDVENNWGQGGNQQSLAEAALVEKIVNSVDARLMNECFERNINPRGAEAPQSIRAAVSRFFEGGSGDKLSTGGLIEDWTNDRIREVAKGITLCATGTKPILNLTISDCGEGQTPRKLPLTIMSLSKSNKMYIPFVQGQFNQGGTGALRFCGKDNIQLVVSRRNPKLLGPDPDDDDSRLGFHDCQARKAERWTAQHAARWAAQFHLHLPCSSWGRRCAPRAQRRGVVILRAASTDIPRRGWPVWPRSKLWHDGQAI